MMSQRERGVEAAGEEVGRSGPAEARGRSEVSAKTWGSVLKGGASELYRAAVSFNAGLIDSTMA